MRDYPEFLNTKEDYLNAMELDKEETIRRLKNVLNERFILEFNDITPVITEKAPEYCLYSKLGFTLDEILNLIIPDRV